MPALAVIGGIGALVTLSGTALTETGSGTPGTTVAIIGAIAVVTVAAIGVIGNYIQGRRTAPSPPGPDTNDLTLHDRVTTMEQILRDIRHDITDLNTRDNNIDARVIPLADVLTAKLDDVYRRLRRLEDGP